MSGGLAKLVGAVTPVVVVPSYLSFLGTSGFGVYEAIVTLGSWLNLANLGVGLGLVNRLALCAGTGDRRTAQTLVTTVAVGSFVALGGLSASWLAVSYSVDWQRILNADTSDITLAVLVGGWATLVSCFASIPAPVYAAYQETHRTAVWDVVTKVTTLLAALAVTLTGWGLPGAVLATLGVPGLVRVANLVSLWLVEKPWLRPRLMQVDWRLIGPVLQEGMGFLGLQLAVVASYQIDRLVIATLIGSHEAAQFGIAARPFLMVSGLSMILFAPLWPAYGDALQRADHAWVRRTLRQSLLVMVGLQCALGILMLSIGRSVIGFWTGDPTAIADGATIAGLACSASLRSWNDCRATVMNAAGQVRSQLIVLGAQALLGAILAVALAKTAGMPGVAWAPAIAALATSAWAYPVLVERLLRKRS